MEKYAYTLYGKPAAASTVGNPYMYTGRRLDAETGLYYYRARYYDPHLRRFIETDPISYVGGMNLYTYVGNSPINWVDPYGLQAGAIGLGPPIFIPQTPEQIEEAWNASNSIAVSLDRAWDNHYNPDSEVAQAGRVVSKLNIVDLMVLWDRSNRAILSGKTNYPPRPVPDYEGNKRKLEESKRALDLKYGGECKGIEEPPGDDCDKMKSFMYTNQFMRLPLYRKLFFYAAYYVNCK